MIKTAYMKAYLEKKATTSVARHLFATPGEYEAALADRSATNSALLAERLGPLTANLPALALLGAGFAKASPLAAALGAGAFVIPAGIAGLSAAATPARGAKEQQEADRRNKILDYIIPGVAAYQRMKRLHGIDQKYDGAEADIEAYRQRHGWA
jgi:hypothetical protein